MRSFTLFLALISALRALACCCIFYVFLVAFHLPQRFFSSLVRWWRFPHNASAKSINFCCCLNCIVIAIVIVLNFVAVCLCCCRFATPHFMLCSYVLCTLQCQATFSIQFAESFILTSICFHCFVFILDFLIAALFAPNPPLSVIPLPHTLFRISVASFPTPSSPR